MNMVARRLPGEQIARALNRLGGQFTAETVFQLNAPPITRSSKVAQLFRHGYARGTIALWLTYFMGLFVIYLLNGWLPTILRSGGLSLQQAAMMTGLFQLGGPLDGILVGMLNLFPRLSVPVVPGGNGFRFGGAVGADFYQRDVH